MDCSSIKSDTRGVRGSAVLLEDIAAVQVAVLVEVVVDRGMGGGEFLQGLYTYTVSPAGQQQRNFG